jgi:hypothetical protein
MQAGTLEWSLPQEGTALEHVVKQQSHDVDKARPDRGVSIIASHRIQSRFQYMSHTRIVRSQASTPRLTTPAVIKQTMSLARSAPHYISSSLGAPF